jgi:hypothetical protein
VDLKVKENGNMTVMENESCREGIYYGWIETKVLEKTEICWRIDVNCKLRRKSEETIETEKPGDYM